MPLPWTYDEYLHSTNWTTNTAIQELKNHDDARPFFLQLVYHRPHPPYDPPWQYFARYQHRELLPVPVGDWAEANGQSTADAWAGTAGHLPPDVQDDSRCAYYAAINHIDDQIGKLLYWLKQNKLYANTWILFVFDHDEMLGDHHRRHKIVPNEGSARIPLVVKPRRKAGGPRAGPATHRSPSTISCPPFWKWPARPSLRAWKPTRSPPCSAIPQPTPDAASCTANTPPSGSS